MSTDKDYEAIGERRALALLDSFKQTYNEVKDRFRKNHPDEPEWLIELVCRIGWYNAWR